MELLTTTEGPKLIGDVVSKRFSEANAAWLFSECARTGSFVRLISHSMRAAVVVSA